MLPFLAAVVEQSLEGKPLLIYASCGAVLSLAWLATDFARTPVWRDNRSFFSLAARQTPTSMAVQARMAEEEIASKDYDAALRRIEWVLRTHSTHLDDKVIDFHLLRGKVLLETNRPVEAYNEFKVYTDYHKKISKSLAILLAEATARSGNLQGALSLLKEELIKSGEDDEVWNGLGNVYLMMKDFPSAVDCYKQALSINPDNQEAASNLRFALSNNRFMKDQQRDSK